MAGAISEWQGSLTRNRPEIRFFFCNNKFRGGIVHRVREHLCFRQSVRRRGIKAPQATTLKRHENGAHLPRHVSETLDIVGDVCSQAPDGKEGLAAPVFFPL